MRVAIIVDMLSTIFLKFKIKFFLRYGCCLDSKTKALGPEFLGCPITTTAPFIVNGTVSPQKICIKKQ